MNLFACVVFSVFNSIPRVSGDEPTMGVVVTDDVTYSPRERG